MARSRELSLSKVASKSIERSKLRILQLIPTLEGGGAERQLSLLAAPLIEAGADLHVAFYRRGVNHELLERSGACLHSIHVNGHYDPRMLKGIVSIVRAVQPTVIHTWLTSMDTAGGMAARWCGVPWLMSERTAPEAYESAPAKLHLRRFLGRFAAGVVGNSGPGLDYWRKLIPAHRRFLVANAVSIDEIENTAPIERSALSLPQELPLLVYAGRFVASEKNVHVLTDAFIDVVGRGDAVAFMCGEGPDREAVQAKVRDAGLSEKIVVSGYRNDLWAILRAASCAVSLSKFEGSGNVVLEAMACGCPLVLSDIPAHRADVADAALYVDGGDAAGVAEAIRSVLSAPDDANLRVARGRLRAAEHAPVHCARQLMSAYERTLRLRSA